MDKGHAELFKRTPQVLAIIFLAGLCSMIAHKAYADIYVLAQQHSGGDLWLAVARHVLRNLAAGA